MKQVLIIDETPLFRDYVKGKLVTDKIYVETALNHYDGAKKMHSILPDLLILDATFSFEELLDFLQRKSANPNTAKIPVILSGPTLEHGQIAQLAPFRIIKYFNKPIKIDIFFETIGQLLQIAIPIDTTPCILETHLNNNIIFVEISQGLNREKITLLGYRISELITSNKISAPKVVLMMSALKLSFVDGMNLELLFKSILSDMRIRDKNVKVLTFDKYTKQLISGHPEFRGIETSTDVTSFIRDIAPKTQDIYDMAELTSLNLLSATEENGEGSVQMRFKSDVGQSENSADDSGVEMYIKVAVIDDDSITRAILQKAFSAINARSDLFENGADFLAAIKSKAYDVVVLDILMPGLNGYEVLTALRDLEYPPAVIVYSSMSNRESVVQALSVGAKSYLIKPLKPEAVVQKAQELLGLSKNG
ncbi:MAG: response regulator [Treponemataceae bacterium]|nr:response regulator [Treponemataceae bacterium]